MRTTMRAPLAVIEAGAKGPNLAELPRGEGQGGAGEVCVVWFEAFFEDGGGIYKSPPAPAWILAMGSCPSTAFLSLALSLPVPIVA